MKSKELLSLLYINRIKPLKSTEKIILAERLQNVQDVFKLNASEIAGIVGRTFKEIGIGQQTIKAAENDMKYLTSGKIGCTFYWDDAYPVLLRNIYDPPFMFFYRGKLPDFNRIYLAIVGTRKASHSARMAARRLAEEWTLSGGVVVSGLALGIDAEAHIGSLSVTGSSVAVLGNGIDVMYPVSNRWIGIEILKNGGSIISEYPPEEPPVKYHFPERNRIISGLSRAIVVVEAPKNSGALITADYALEQGRELLVHRSGIENGRSLGTEELMEAGAFVVEKATDIFNILGMKPIEREVVRDNIEKFKLSPAVQLVNSLKAEMKDKGLAGDY